MLIWEGQKFAYDVDITEICARLDYDEVKLKFNDV